jgi:2-hydroxy-3-keto-5-methylthiopentenyl-1-phosphate phosphatase
VITFFVDFDGTITKQDTCNAMAKEFSRGNWEALDEMWKERTISTEECARRTFKMFDADEEAVKHFLNDNIQLDDNFIPFLNLCRENGYNLYVVSDGYDFNINTIFDKYDIKNVPFYSNSLIIKGKCFDINCPYTSASCKLCGVCKTEIIRKLKPESGISVYIGDGHSDRCPAEKCDITFAKNELLQYCRENHIPAKPFTDFRDIIDWVNSVNLK